MRTITKLGRVAAAVVLGALTAVGAAAAPSQADVRLARAPGSGTQFALLNYNSGLCVVARGYTAGAPAVSTPCARYEDQVWYVTTPSGWGTDARMIHNLNSGKCLLSPNHGASAYRAVQTVCDSRYADQIWRFDEADAGSYQLVNMETGLCLVQRGYASGTQAVTSGCSRSYDDQKWVMVPPNHLPHP